jgi:hypothetical protein
VEIDSKFLDIHVCLFQMQKLAKIHIKNFDICVKVHILPTPCQLNMNSCFHIINSTQRFSDGDGVSEDNYTVDILFLYIILYINAFIRI